jgi:hypothetical protein
MHQPERDQAVDRLEGIDRMAARERIPACAHTDSPPSRILWITATGSFSSGMPTTASAKIGLPPIAYTSEIALVAGDAAEVERIVDDGREEVGGRDERLLVVQR